MTDAIVAALYVEPRGVYAGLDDVDLWDEARDARTYRGPHPVVAHPPCARWCRMAGVVEARYGYSRGDDGGTFAAALSAVRRWGGVLEHPAYSDAFAAHELARPVSGAWQRELFGDGWLTEVSQNRYGHPARKMTWLYVVGAEPPALDWGEATPEAWVGWGDHDRYPDQPRIAKAASLATPPAFATLLLDIARACRQ